MSHILESVMLICFGLAWPPLVFASWKARTAKGKSLPFLIAIEMGYTAGIAAKIVANDITYVLAFYTANWLMVAVEIALFFRNKKLDKDNADG